MVGEATACLPLGKLIDIAAEKARLQKAIAKTDQELDRISSKLGNAKFVANANPEVVASERERQAELLVQRAALVKALQNVSEAD